MLFNSTEFVLLFLIVLGIYPRLALGAQNWLLLLASCVFYAWWDWRYLGLVAFSGMIDYVVALRLEREERDAVRARLLLVSLTTNVGLLGVFKYYDFFAESARELLTALGFVADDITLKLVLPVGISFYTFQSLSYTIDVYRRQLAPCRSLREFAVFIMFFPQLVAGPIERARHLLPQMMRPRRVTLTMAREGLWLLLFGYYKKTVLADNLSPFTDRVFGAPTQAHGLEVLLAVYAFALQIYGDFSGYSDIARGTARLLGFDLMHNFRMPYLSTNPSEFWQRWHISLSTWLRDYLYVSLGGNRGGVRKTYRNLLLTMVLGGLWHGAAWNFIAWGAYQGALLCVHRAFGGKSTSEPERLTPKRLLRAGMFFQLVCFGWLLFAVRKLGDIAILAQQLVSPFELNGKAALADMLVFAAPVITVDLLQFHGRSMETLPNLPRPVRLFAYATLFCLIVASGRPGGHDFIYFQF